MCDTLHIKVIKAL